MKTTIDIDLTPKEYCTEALLKETAARKVGLKAEDITHVQILRRSLDSRRGRVLYHTHAEVYCGETFVAPDFRGHYQDCHNKPPSSSSARVPRASSPPYAPWR